MTDKLSVDDIQSEHADRDGNGDLIASTEEIEWGGETKEIEVYPVTTGKANEISEYESGLATLDPLAVANVVSVMCPHLSLSKSDVEDLPTDKLNNLVSPITDQLPEVEAGNS